MDGFLERNLGEEKSYKMTNKIGKAYAFLDYAGEEKELMRSMRRQRDRANFPDSFRFRVLDDKDSARYSHERRDLPSKVAELAKTKKVYGAVSSDRMEDLPKVPKKVLDLRYLVMAEAPEVNDRPFAKPLGQARANQVTAEWLAQILSFVREEESKSGRSKFLRSTVFYQDSRRRAQEY